MKALKIFKYLLDLIYIYFIISIFTGIFLSSKLLFTAVPDISKESLPNYEIGNFLMHSTEIIGLVMIVLVLHYCRKVVNNWNNEDFFHVESSRHLKKAGVLIFVGLALSELPFLIFNILNPAIIHGEITRTYSINSSSTSQAIILTIGFGLFLLILSTIIGQARNLKTENDLTI